MASPLLTKSNSAMNKSYPSPKKHMAFTLHQDADVDDSEDPPSSPFIENVSQSENIAPIKLEASSPSPASRNGNSPLKMLKMRADINNTKERSPRKLSSPEKRFPVKVSTLTENRPIEIKTEATSTLQEVLRDNEGLTRAIQIMEDEYSEIDYEDTECEFDDTIVTHNGEVEAEGFADETAFSTFSAVPDMTMFAKIGHTPTKLSAFGQTPRLNGTYTPATLRRPNFQNAASPTPRRQQANEPTDADTTNLILDFTEQFNNFSTSARYLPHSPTKSQTVPELFNYTHNARTPSPQKARQQQPSTYNRMSNLLDFDIPPPPTPRSMPSVTPRELETLKSALLSEISSLKASLSGKEAEVLSLKNAIGDAEKRVGETMEQVLEERSLKEQLEAEKEAWEKRSREMEMVLRNVKEEIVHCESERDDLEGRLEESEKRREAAEMMAQEAESKMASMRASSGPASANDNDASKDQPAASGREVEIAVEKVARELHTLYKSKHENKVAALKKSYEGRWDRKVKDLETKVDDLLRENEELRVGRDATMSAVVPRIPGPDATLVLRSQAAKDAQNAKELEARVEGLSQEIQSIKQDNANLRSELERERIEKGELVAACDELLALQEAPQSQHPHPSVTAGVENLRGSISRASGLRAPNFSAASAPNGHVGESRIGRVDKTRSGSAQGVRPGSGLSMRSGIMSSIEKMGSYKGRAE